MLREVLLAKLHHVRITECKPEYSGSITIDRDLLDAAGLLPNEKVLVADCENGNRFETYIFEGEPGSGQVIINGASAHLTGEGHRAIILAFCTLEESELATHKPIVLVCDEHNKIADRPPYPTCVLSDGAGSAPAGAAAGAGTAG